MRTFWRALGRIFFWSYERMTWQYDVMVALIVAFVLLTPRHWFHDQPKPVVHAQVVTQDAGSRTVTYRLDAGALGGSGHAVNMTPEIQRRAHDALSHSVRELKGSSFQVVGVEPKLANDGTVAYYEVTVRR